MPNIPSAVILVCPEYTLLHHSVISTVLTPLLYQSGMLTVLCCHSGMPGVHPFIPFCYFHSTDSPFIPVWYAHSTHTSYHFPITKIPSPHFMPFWYTHSTAHPFSAFAIQKYLFLIQFGHAHNIPLHTILEWSQ